MYEVVMSLHKVTYSMGLSMAAVERGFEECLWTLFQFRERFPPCWTEGGVIRNIIVLKIGTLIFYRQVFASHLIILSFLTPGLEQSELFILFVSTVRDQSVKP